MSGSQVGVPELLDPPRLFAGRILCNEVAGGLVGFSAAGMAAVRPNALAAGPRPADEAGEWWTRLLIGEYFEVEYSDDNVESMALWPVSEGRWVVKSPGGGVLIENLDGSDPETGPAVSRPLRRHAGAFAPLYLFPSSEVWWSAVAGRHTLAGSELLSMTGRDVKFGYRTAMIQVGSEWLVADRVKVADAPALVAPEATPAQLGIASGLDGGAAASTLRNIGSLSDTARTLWVDWDSHEELSKAWREIGRACQEAIPDGHFEGVTTALHLCPAVERQGGDPRRWLTSGLLEKMVDPADRVAQMLRSLTDTLHLAGVVDQVNVGGLPVLELVCHRTVVIVEAYATSATPSWEHAKFYVGAATAEEVMAPALRSYVLKRAMDEQHLFSARARTAPRGASGGGSHA